MNSIERVRELDRLRVIAERSGLPKDWTAYWKRVREYELETGFIGRYNREQRQRRRAA